MVVQTSKGSVDNVSAIQEGQIESGFSQSDIAYGAFSGTGIFAGRPPMQNLRALASLYLESVHLVARAGSGIASVADLRGQRVSLDVEGSGTLVEARLIRQTTTTPAPQQKPHPVWWMIGGGALVGCGVLIGALL